MKINYEELISNSINNQLVRMSFSKPVKGCEITRIKVRPVIIKDAYKFQVTKTVGSKETNTVKEIHENMSYEELAKYLPGIFPNCFKQALIESKSSGYTLLAGKKNNVTVIENKSVGAPISDLSHNNTKQYILKEGVAVPFLVDLGVMTEDGHVTKAKYDKFRQINRYLEFVRDIVPCLPTDRTATIVDFGCGKSYLTFALYYYLKVMLGMNVEIIGLDLKTDVIKECTRLKNKYAYNSLSFCQGSIEEYTGKNEVDMVITLHACDTATDYAIYKAIKWNAKVIMAVPCCQHELNRALKNSRLKGICEYGLLKERFAALMTDAMRANLMAEAGYETDVLEFIDMEHTPKNILLRGIYRGGMLPKGVKERSDSLFEIADAQITLKRLLDEDNQ